MKVLVFDNYDSFTYNLVQIIEQILGEKVDVFRNDEIPLEDINRYDKIILSPGPGIPEEAGILLEVIKKYAPAKSIFGVCLGQQAIAEAFGGSLINLQKPFHGVATPINVVVDDELLFKNLPKTFNVGRYHSWVVAPTLFPNSLEITSVAATGEIMSLRHKTLSIKAVQFHPESILTEYGKEILQNWLATL